MAFDPNVFIDDFRGEADEHLRALDAQLLALERDPTDPVPIRLMFISAHTIKGGGAMLGLHEVADLAHTMESVLARLRDDRRALDPKTADLLFRALDLLRAIIPEAVPGVTNDEAAVTELAVALRRRVTELESWPLPERVETALVSQTRRVLLVDDSSTVRLLVTMQLSEAGFEVDAIDDGMSALNMALKTPYDLLVTSIEVRGLRGFDLVAALRAIPEHHDLLVIVISASDDPEQRARAAELRVHAYLQKGSMGEHELVRTATELLSRERMKSS